MKSLDEKSIVQNSGVNLEVESLQFSISKYQNPIFGSMTYYGVIKDICEVHYTKFYTIVLKCRWVDNKNGVRMDESRMIQVDFRMVGINMSLLSWHINHIKFFM